MCRSVDFGVQVDVVHHQDSGQLDWLVREIGTNGQVGWVDDGTTFEEDQLITVVEAQVGMLIEAFLNKRKVVSP